MRINKFLREVGLGSRRKCEDLVNEGKVVVNGNPITDLSFDVKNNDIVLVDGKWVKNESVKKYIMLNKPKGYITTTSDDKGRKTVIDILPTEYKNLLPVGRLDYETEGLLLLSNDGDFIFSLTHPSCEVPKTYIATVIGEFKESELAVLRAGVKIGEVKYSKCKVKLLGYEKGLSRVEITIHEGKNREVRNMLEAVNKPIKLLKRTAIGELKLTGLNRGEFRELRVYEIEYLKSL